MAYKITGLSRKVRLLLTGMLIVMWLVICILSYFYLLIEFFYGCTDIPFVIFVGLPDSISIGINFGSDKSLHSLFLLGLMAGLLTFGGAYTCKLCFFLIS